MNHDDIGQNQSVSSVPPYTADDASASLNRAAGIVLALTAVGLPLIWYLRDWRSALLLLVGSLISATGLWEWKRLMAALMARMDAQDAVQASSGKTVISHLDADPDRPVKAPSIAFAIVGFVLRLAVVIVVLYVSLKYLHGSVLALAAGLALGVIALTVEGVRLLRSGTI